MGTEDYDRITDTCARPFGTIGNSGPCASAGSMQTLPPISLTPPFWILRASGKVRPNFWFLINKLY